MVDFIPYVFVPILFSSWSLGYWTFCGPRCRSCYLVDVDMQQKGLLQGSWRGSTPSQPWGNTTSKVKPDHKSSHRTTSISSISSSCSRIRINISLLCQLIFCIIVVVIMCWMDKWIPPIEKVARITDYNPMRFPFSSCNHWIQTG